MTVSSVEDIRSRFFRRDDRLFLDANIWLSIYGPLAYPRKRSQIYSKALYDIRRAGSCVFLDVLVLSEFVNGYARWEYKQLSPKPPNFKTFRESASFKPVAADIAQNAKRIVKQCHLCDSRLATTDIESLLMEFALGEVDFNDQMIAEICREEGFELITDDADFKGPGLRIITANNLLLTS